MAEEQGQGPADDQNEEEVVENEQDEDSSSDDEQEESDSRGDDKGDTVSKAEFQRILDRMKAADRAKSAAEAKLREKERAEMGDLDRAKSELEEQKTRAEELESRLNALLIENAFHRENKIIWHDVSDAIAALDMSGVEITEDGKVTGMADAIKNVAKKKPHYVKSIDEGDGDAPPAANSATNGQRKGKKSETLDSKRLASRFPALGK